MSTSHNKYVDLLVNGRLFPIWVMSNFKQYKLSQILLGTEDPCNLTTKEVGKKLRNYQLFAGKFLDYRSPYKNILMYHGLGSGKTAATINVYNVLYNANPGWNVFILNKAGLRQTWIDEIDEWMAQQDDKEHRIKNIRFVNYDSPFADKSFLEEVRISDSSKNNLFIIEECHNFIKNVYSNITTNKGRRAQIIYDYIMQHKQEYDTTRVILLSGTPAINEPYELALLFNLLRTDSFPKSESLFNQLFVNRSANEINSANKNMFQRRILGLTSYYTGATPDYYATKKINVVKIEMSSYQKNIYKYFDDLEKRSQLKTKGKGQTYKTYTRQACNFVFPNISQRITGEQRPRPTRFAVSEELAHKMSEGRAAIDKLNKNVSNYFAAVETFISAFDNYINDINTNDNNKKYTLNDDIDKFVNKYKYNYDDFFEDKQKSDVFNALHSSSPKILRLIFTSLISPGPIIIYTNYVIMEGLQIIKIYLKYFGFSKYGDAGKDNHRYIEYSGQIDKVVREENKKIFNQPENKYGKNIRIFLLSPAASEGLTIRNIRQIHILEPYWHEVRITQMIGRGIRNCSHSDLPRSERHVDVFRYIMTNNTLETADQYVEKQAMDKDKLITSFLSAVKETAIDCELFSAHNDINEDATHIKCFKFNENSLFEKQIGPAYKKDIMDDILMNNGSNAPNSTTIKIKVSKISAVKKISEGKYSKEENYWYYPDSGVAYDFDLHYPIGKIECDSIGVPKKYDGRTYIIDKVIPIPII